MTRPEIDARLRRITEKLPAGCNHCRRWGPSVLIDDDGNVTRPECCPFCTRRVPVAIYHHIVGIPLEAL